MKLIVEVDGAQHAESARDVERDSYFESQGFRTVRYWNDDVVDRFLSPRGRERRLRGAICNL